MLKNSTVETNKNKVEATIIVCKLIMLYLMMIDGKSSWRTAQIYHDEFYLTQNMHFLAMPL